MDFNEYKAALQRIEEKLDTGALLDAETFTKTECFVSANLGNFIPEIPYTNHLSITKSILIHRERSIVEGKYNRILDSVQFGANVNSILQQLKQCPSIIYSFHLGSMHLINHWLAKNKLAYSFIASRRTLDENLGHFLEMAERQTSAYGDIDLYYIEADEPNAAVKMLRALKNGKHLLMYIDGNVGTKKENDRLTSIHFLAKRIAVRSGAALLSYWSAAPLIGALAYRNEKKIICMDFFEPLYPQQQNLRAIEEKRLMQAAYDYFSVLLKKYPDQWECWIYLHKWLHVKELTYKAPITLPSDYYVFNEQDFGLFRIKDDCFLFCKRNYLSYELKEQMYQRLCEMRVRKIKTSSIDLTWAQGLLKVGAVLYS
ncbi:hypothetical protein [Pedobacter sp. MW01-1-1]|uniref:hypothetical protein n=1 Tax=Pedobacter sp. MW01-1-1 TaxID=3383027 RepID=UPI003FF09B37